MTGRAVPKSSDWFIDMFGSAVADVRSKLIDEAWFDRRPPERADPFDLGWWRDDRDIGRDVLDGLGPEHFAPWPERDRTPDPDHDLER